MSKFKIAISPSQQTENSCVLGDTEQDHMFLIGKCLFDILQKDDRFEAFLTTKLPKMNQGSYLYKCVEETEKWQRDDGLRLSLHSDAGYNAHGCSVFPYSVTSVGYKFAQEIYKQMSILTPWNDIGVKCRPELYEIRKPTAPSILIECSFHDQKTEAEFLHNKKEEIAQKIYLGILNTLGWPIIVEKPDVIENELPEWKKIELENAFKNKIITDKDYWFKRLSNKDTITASEVMAMLNNIFTK